MGLRLQPNLAVGGVPVNRAPRTDQPIGMPLPARRSSSLIRTTPLIKGQINRIQDGSWGDDREAADRFVRSGARALAIVAPDNLDGDHSSP